jgi:D-mannonate dehydratase
MSLKIGLSKWPSTDGHLAFVARFGIKNIVANPSQADRTRRCSTAEKLPSLREQAEKHGLSVEIASCDFMSSGSRQSDIMLGTPGRDEEIEVFKTHKRLVQSPHRRWAGASQFWR